MSWWPRCPTGRASGGVGGDALIVAVVGTAVGDLVLHGRQDLAQVDIQPHRVETFKFSTDLRLEAKIRDVVAMRSFPNHITPGSNLNWRLPY